MLAKKKILVADAQEDSRKQLLEILSPDYIVIQAESETAAMTVIQTQHEEICAVLLNPIMPGMGGYDLLETLSHTAEYTEIPVVVVSPTAQGNIEEKAFRLGAREFVCQPYNPAVLIRRLSNLMELSESNSSINKVGKDSLTGLYNKHAFFHYADKLLRRTLPDPCMLIAGDVEKFKLINDTLGPAEGDQLLKYIGKQLKDNVDRLDGICARMGADRFVVLLPKVVDCHVMHEVTAALDNRLSTYAPHIKNSMKFGFYTITDSQVPISIMVDRAFLAASSIKGQYENYCACYDDSMRLKLLEEQEIINEILPGLQNEEFEVYLQPKYNFKTGRLSGAEALVRWNHPKRGLLTPDTFIPLLEKTGLISKLDTYMWDRTCRIIREWMDSYGGCVPVSVNVSRADVYKADLPRTLSGIVKHHGLRPQHLHLEITETAYTKNARQLISVVNALRDAGFQIDMDDFGSGYSSLNMLTALPIDTVKLDMGFVLSNITDAAKRSVLKAVISLSHELQLRVTAEGVETKGQALILKELSCDYAQGFYFGKPMPNREFVTLLREHITAEAQGRMLTMAISENTEEKKANEAQLIAVGYNTLLNNLPAGLHRCQMFGKRHVDYINTGFTDMTGYSMEDIHDLFSDQFVAMVVEEDKNAFAKAYDELSEKPGKRVLEYRLRRKDGEIIRVTDYFRSVLLPNGQIWGFGIISDITESRETFAQLKLLMDAIPGGVAVFHYSHGDIKTLYASSKVWEMFGYTQEEFYAITSPSPTNILQPDDAKQMHEQFLGLLEHDQQMNCTCRVRAKNGEYRWMNFRATASERTKDSMIINGVMFDVTAEKMLDFSLTDYHTQQQELSAIIRAVPGGIFKYSASEDDQFIFVSDTLLKMLGYTQEEFTQKFHNRFSEMIWHEDREQALQKINKDIWKTGSTDTCEYRIQTKSGKLKWVYDAGHLITDENGKKWFIVVVVDQDERKALEERLRIGEEEMNYAMTKMGKMICTFDIATRTLTMPEEYAKKHNLSKTQYVIPPGTTGLRHLDEVSEPNFKQFCEAILRGDRMGSTELHYNFRHGAICWERSEFFNIFDNCGQPIKAIIAIEDITAQHIKEETLSRQAERDSLTKLYNKVSAFSIIEQMLQHQPDSHHSMMIFDVDNFKGINDQFGHAAGDQVLTAIAEIMRRLFEKEDILSRFGGDEFVIFVSNVTSEQAIKERVEQFLHVMRAELQLKFPDLEVTISLGVAISDGPADTKELFSQADRALYDAKRKGKNRYSIYTSGLMDSPQSKKLEQMIISTAGGVAVYKVLPDKLETVYCSKSLAQLRGYTFDEYNQLKASDAWNRIYPSDVEKVKEFVQGLKADSSENESIFRIYHKNGSVIWVQAAVQLIGYEDGCQVIQVLFHNVSHDMDLCNSVLDISDRSVHVSDMDTYEILFANTMAARIAGADPCSYLGKKCYEWIAHRDSPCAVCPHNEIRKSGIYTGEQEFEGRCYRQKAKAIQWNGHNAFIEYAEDITELKRAQAILQQKPKQL